MNLHVARITTAATTTSVAFCVILHVVMSLHVARITTAAATAIFSIFGCAHVFHWTRITFATGRVTLLRLCVLTRTLSHSHCEDSEQESH
jgi:hypothetical protein